MLDAKLQETGEKERLKECPLTCCCQARIYDEQNGQSGLCLQNILFSFGIDACAAMLFASI